MLIGATQGISPKIREIHEILGTKIYCHGFLETYIFQISPKIRETRMQSEPGVAIILTLTLNYHPH